MRESGAKVVIWYRRMLARGVMFLMLMCAPIAHAQTVPELPIAWASLYPLIYRDQNGDTAGFMVDLARQLGPEVGFKPAFYQVDTFSEWSAAQGSGASALILGTAKGLGIEDTNVFSTALFEAEVGLAVLPENAKTIHASDVSQLRIGTIRPGAGSDPALYPGAQMAYYPNVDMVLFALLAGDIDAISTTTLFIYAAARKAKLDNRVVFLPPPVLKSGRYISIHESQAALREPINAALARMKADGRLDALLARHNITVPLAPPDVLTVGVTNFPPYNVYNDDGTFTGFGVETFDDLANLAGLSVRYVPISNPEFFVGPNVGAYDAIVQAGIDAERAEVMDFTLAVDRSAFAIFTRRGQAEGLSDLDSLVGRTVGVEAINLGRHLVQKHGGLNIRVFDGVSALAKALADGTVEAAVFATTAMNREIVAQGLTDQIEEVTPPFHVVARAPALRPGLGVVREQLNAVIPGYLISDEYAALRATWFGVPVFWTRERVYAAAGAGGLLFLIAGGSIWGRQYNINKMRRKQRFERQQKELDREQRHSSELGQLVLELERSNSELNNFAYVASHDLKEPLRGIAINADFLLREEVSDKGKKRVERMVELTTRMEQLISDLLYFSRLGREDTAKQEIDPTKLTAGINSELREVLDEIGGTITVAPGLPNILAEPAKITVVLQNLILNGLKYNDADRKTIHIGFETQIKVDGKMLRDVFFVRDNGIGMAEGEHKKIFRIFTRLNREADYGRGTGAGLSFVKKIIEEYGGMITLTSKEGAGTTFYFSLPLAGTKAQTEKTEKTVRDKNKWTQLQPY